MTRFLRRVIKVGRGRIATSADRLCVRAWMRPMFIAVALGCVVLGAEREAVALNPLHVNVTTGGQDPDGDHVLDAVDPQDNVYCGEGHADVTNGANTGLDGAVDLSDLIRAWSSLGAPVPHTGNYLEYVDQNHNDIGDWLDSLHVFKHYGASTIPDCGSTVPGLMPLPQEGATFGPPLLLDIVSFPSSYEVSLYTPSDSPSPFIGYWATIYFDETKVQATTVVDLTLISPSSGAFGAVCDPSLTALIDNTNDVSDGPDGSIGAGCGFWQFDGGNTGFLTRTTDGPLAKFKFAKIASGDPGFHLQTFYGKGNDVTATYTIGLDIAPQIPDTDEDDDGCPATKEGGLVAVDGGLRDWREPYDFFDVIDGAGLGRDKVIDLSDILNVLAFYGAGPGTLNDIGILLDRDNPNPLAPWASVSASNGIDLTDILANIAQYGHSCAASP